MVGAGAECDIVERVLLFRRIQASLLIKIVELCRLF